METRQSGTLRSLLILGGILGVLGVAWLALPKQGRSKGEESSETRFKPTVDAPASPVGGEASGALPLESGGRAPTQAEALLRGLPSRLRTGTGREMNRGLMLELRVALASMPAAEASSMIQRFLAAAQDASTSLPLTLGPGGHLVDAPTLRVFLMDYLEQVDPAAAARLGLETLQRMDSADEWAMALRSVAKDTTGGDRGALLTEKVRQLFSHDAWQQNPSEGYLESFDVAVHVGGVALLPDLARMLRKTNNQAVAHAAFLATDRLVQREPAPTLEALLTEPGLLEGREATRANYVARADLSDERQRRLVMSYLLNPGIAAAELEAFAEVFPNENSMLSNNLLTRNRTRSGAEIQERDTQSLRIIEDWLRDPRFKSAEPALTIIRSRLRHFLGAAGR